jgi:hypothetical protein
VEKAKQWFHKDKEAVNMWDKMFYDVPRKVLPHGQNQCPERENFKFLA